MTIDLTATDARIAAFMGRHGSNALRYSLAVIFLWFGILKPLSISPAEPLVLMTVNWMPFFAPAFGSVVRWCRRAGRPQTVMICDSRGIDTAPGGRATARRLVVTAIGRATVISDKAQILAAGGACP